MTFEDENLKFSHLQTSPIHILNLYNRFEQEPRSLKVMAGLSCTCLYMSWKISIHLEKILCWRNMCCWQSVSVSRAIQDSCKWRNIDRFGFITQTKPKYRQLVFHKIAKTKLTNIDLKAQLWVKDKLLQLLLGCRTIEF